MREEGRQQACHIFVGHYRMSRTTSQSGIRAARAMFHNAALVAARVRCALAIMNFT